MSEQAKQRGEGKKTGRGEVPYEAPVPRPLPGGGPVGVLVPREDGTEAALLTELAACGFQVRALSAESPLEGLAVLLVAGEAHEALARAKSLAALPGAPPVLLCGPVEDWGLVMGALEGGLFDFVPLPLEPVELTRKVSRAQKLER